MISLFNLIIFNNLIYVGDKSGKISDITNKFCKYD